MWATIKLVVVLVGLSVPAALIALPWKMVTGDSRLIYEWGSWIAHLALRVAGVKMDVQGLEKIPAGRACLFMSNHLSNLDPPVIVPSLPGHVVVMVKKELMRIPLLGTSMKMVGYVPVERGQREKTMATLAAAEESLRMGRHMFVFPEGTRSRDGEMLPFKKGSFELAMRAGVPVVPVAIWGTERMLRKGEWKIKRGVAHVRVLDAIYPEEFGTREELMERVRGAIAAGKES